MRLYVGWQDEETRRWYTVGALSSNNEFYYFSYTKGAQLALQNSKFIPFSRMNDLDKQYKSEELFPIFSNRILPKSRPDYSEYLEWMGLEDQEIDPLAILTRSGGEKATDNLQIYPMPEKTEDGKYKAYFFVNGMRYLPTPVVDLIEKLEIGSQLFPMLDCNNSKDTLAVALRADDPTVLVGYCPRYIAEEIGELAQNLNHSLKITVNRINKSAPSQMKLRCKVEAIWPEDFQACNREEFKLLSSIP